MCCASYNTTVISLAFVKNETSLERPVANFFWRTKRIAALGTRIYTVALNDRSKIARGRPLTNHLTY